MAMMKTRILKLLVTDSTLGKDIDNGNCGLDKKENKLSATASSYI